jgi:CheY-like chemotaxis protein
MVKKRFLFRNEAFCEEEPYLIASLIGPGYGAASLFTGSGTYGGLVNFPIDKVESDALLEDSATWPVLDSCLAEALKAGDVQVTVIGTEYDETTLKPGQPEYTIDKIAAHCRNAGAVSAETRIENAMGLKIYFKNWDNSLRVMPVDMPKCFESRQPVIEESPTIRVLVVDDSSLVQNILKRSLGKDEAIEIAGTASDVFSATEQILEHDPDVILLDVVMPQINGLNFLKILMNYNPKPVVIFSTLGKTGGNVEKQAVDSGACDVIDKRSLNLSNPRSIETIKEKIKAAASVPVKRMRKE